MTINKNKRAFIRVGIKQLTSIVRASGGDYEVVEGDEKTVFTKVKILDISTGGLCIESKNQIKEGVSFDLEIPKIKNLDTYTIRCECTRSIFREDPLYNKSFHEVGLKFENPNNKYLKQLYELAIAKKI
ncbi:MAG: PilZ domain-containing protein [Nitrospinaceae bacterium]|nr:PilZ domain-containing protein [Nitrospina sp.]MDG1843210.1 PilZ domain-containing protein [Nitrospinaceae bacterium]